MLAKLRDDRYARLLEQPLLLALRPDGAAKDLKPTEGAELKAVNREPARRSRPHFERDAEGRDHAEELHRATAHRQGAARSLIRAVAAPRDLCYPSPRNLPP